MLITSIFSFWYNVFYPSLNKLQIFNTFILSSANALKLNQSDILFGEELTLYSIGTHFDASTTDSF